jgi:hypothetical protein
MENADWRKLKPKIYPTSKHVTSDAPSPGSKPNTMPSKKKRRMNAGSQGWSDSIPYFT